MALVCTTYYANRSTTAVDRLLSTISIAEFLMCLPFHTLQLTHKIPTPYGNTGWKSPFRVEPLRKRMCRLL